MIPSVFPRFHPRLQSAIVSRLGWSSLRPVQDLAGPPILEGHNAIVLAPTAGGKTEASMFPVISRLMDRTATGVGALYIAPIKALLNNQADRLGTYTEMVGLQRFVWHGDVGTSQRKQFIKDPTDLLMTTPESLEVMLVSQTLDPAALLGNVEMIVIDEVHAIAGTDRGAHLMSVLERISALGRRDIQRIGLSATVGNPPELLDWLQGSSQRPKSLIDPPAVPSKRQLLIVQRDEFQDLAEDAARIARGKKSLYFCQSRRLAESVADALRAYGTEVFVHHSAVSREERLLAEEKFHHGTDACIVCTSTLELGIDVGDLDLVLQADAPSSVSSFMQRMGRTGRRAGQAANTTFFCNDPDSVIQAYALIELARRKEIEPVQVSRRVWPVLVHQLLAMSLSQAGTTATGAWEHFSRVPDFSGIHKAEFDRLLAWLIEDGAIRLASGRLVIGPKAEKKFGRKNFMELYAVFSSPQSYTVMKGEQPIGTLAQEFVDDLVEGVSTFLLAGRGWEVQAIVHDVRTVKVTPAGRGKEPTWGGMTPSMLGLSLCQEMRAVLASDDEPAFLHPTALKALQDRRGALADVAQSRDGLEDTNKGIRWWTFAGGKINSTLKHAIATMNGEWTITTDNLGISLIGAHRSDFAEVKARLLDPDFWSDEKLWDEVAKSLPAYRLSKFQPLMPQWIQQEMLGAFLLDVEGAWRWLTGGEALRWSPVRLDVTDRLLEATATVRQPAPEMPDKVEWVSTSEHLARAAREWASLPAIGLAMQTTIGGRLLCLVQVSSGERTWLIDPFEVSDLGPLAEVLEAPQPEKMVRTGGRLAGSLRNLGVKLVSAVELVPVRDPAAHDTTDAEYARTPRSGDWARRPLTSAQVNSAVREVRSLVAGGRPALDPRSPVNASSGRET